MEGEAGRAAITPSRQQQVAILLGASVLLSLSMGMRQSFGLFLLPVTRQLGFSVADFTFAMALQNLIWGFVQPFVGAYADRYGSRPVMLLGCVFYSLGMGTMAFCAASRCAFSRSTCCSCSVTHLVPAR